MGLYSCQPSNKDENQTTTNLEIKDGAYFINGEKTFISALGYQVEARPGQHPKEDVKVVHLNRMRKDLKNIKDAGFNTIRTWDEMSEQELKLVQESGLYLIYGIEINQYGEWGDATFITSAFERVKRALDFSKNYDCIITYLVMNEPYTQQIHDKGAKATLNLWNGIIDIIHDEHPGIPVSISPNSRISEWLSEKIFDVYGFNIYDHIEDQIYTQGYGPHIQYLKEVNGEGKPLLITEFGLSISTIGWGLYGGNTLKTQAEWVVKNYSELLDGGAAGACPFYYADGWWKANEPSVHNPYPEEWFGYRGYADVNDTVSYPRPVWYEISEYIQAIISSPRNNQIYSNNVPVEVFLTDKIAHVRVLYNDKIILDQKNIYKKHFTSELNFGTDSIVDRELVFEFFDAKGKLIKYEIIMMLTSKNQVKLPSITVEVAEEDLSKSKVCEATITIRNDSPFTLDNTIKYVFSPHIGWNAGENKINNFDPTKKEYQFKAKFDIPNKSLVMNVSAGIDIKYGKFVKRISDVKLLYRGSWADPLKAD